MLKPTVRIVQTELQPNKRILVTSDIHGNLAYLREVLDKADFSGDNYLFIVGDIIEKGPQSLKTLRYVMQLCERGNVFPLIGNVDAYRLQWIDELCEESAEGFYDYLLKRRRINETSFYDELAEECGFVIASPTDVLTAKPFITEHFKAEFDFLAGLPTVIETQNYVFVHAGLPEKRISDNANADIFSLLKTDRFMQQSPHRFDKYIIVGHMPVGVYNTEISLQNPIIDRKKRIISIDGGCGVNRDGQLNMLIIPDIDSPVDKISTVSADSLPVFRACSDQRGGGDSLHICWPNFEIITLEKGDEYSYVKHVQSGKRLCVPNAYLVGDTQCKDYTDYELPVKSGDMLSLIFEASDGYIVKKNGVIGWYYGKLEKAK